VIFADAATDVEDDASFYLRPVHASPDTSYSSHSLSPAAVLHLTAQCFGAWPRGWILGIRPVDLDTFAEGLTDEAEANLASALEALLAAFPSD
jgi:Ni,Fe-hydrogenase maturation factor